MNGLHESYQITSIASQLANNTTVNGGWVDAGNARRVFALLNVGAIDIALNAKLQQAQDSSGTGAKDITGAAITAYAATDDNKQVSIDLDPAKLDIAGGFSFVRLAVTIGNGTTGANFAASLFAQSKHAPSVQPAAFFQKVVVAG